MLDNANWHKRFLQQAGWTRNLRNYLLNQIELPENADILDVGCGTGALFLDFEPRHDTYIGLDLDHNRLTYAQAHFADTNLICAKGEKMPLRNRSFDLVFLPLFAAMDPASHTALKGNVPCITERRDCSRLFGT